MTNNYTVLHCHTMLSNATTTIDSVTKFQDYIDKAKECGMKALAISEHGNIMEWWHKKCAIEKAGMKYIHACEVYITTSLKEKFRDNYHCLLIAKNKEGFHELNRLVSRSYNKNDGHFYYNPRITYDELKNTSDNIIVSTACVGGIMNKGEDTLQNDFLLWLYKNKHRCFLEIQHHQTAVQVEYNKKLIDLSIRYGIPLLATTDTHCLNEKHVRGRSILQKAKNIYFDDEEGWDLCFRTYDELCDAFQRQGIAEEIYKIALNNTNKIADIIEPFELTKETKYPKIYDNPLQTFKDKINKGFKDNQYIKQRYSFEEVKKRLYEELAVYEKTGSIDFMLMQAYLREWEKENGVQCGYARGCFTKDAMVYTKQSMKTINKVQIGDEILSDDGMWHPVINTMAYDIKEDMIEFEYHKQGSSYKKYKNICTTDHKILVHRDDRNVYIEAQRLQGNDLLCSPKIKTNNTNQNKIIIDLQKYNDFGFEYDDNYIYEENFANDKLKYSSYWCTENIGGNNTFWKRIVKKDTNNPIGKERIKLLLDNTPFKTLDDYRKYIQKNRVCRKVIPRYITLDYLWNCFIGLMYGDGWTQKNHALGLAVNHTSKNGFNRYVFLSIAKRLGLNVYINVAKNRNLDQMFINSKILNNMFRIEFFESVKGKEKQFNTKLFEQTDKMLKGLYIGLMRSDGSVNETANKQSFDNTSLSLVSAMKTLDNIVNKAEPLSFDVRLAYKDNRGYNNKESYKTRRPLFRRANLIQEDDDYWYLPITKIIRHENKKTKVYDLTIKDNHSYTINNIIVHNSASGSMIAYLLNITQMDSLKFNLNFFRFMNPDRVSNADIDTDYSERDREKVKRFLLKDHMNIDNIQCSEIITFNTIAVKGAIKDVARAMDIPLDKAQHISNQIINDEIPNDLRQQYPELFEYVDIVNGVVMSIGSHPSGVLVTDRDINSEIGTCTLSTSDYPVSMLNMKELDDLMYVKLDLLGLDNIGIINDTCKMIGLDRFNPDNINLNDEKVWKSIRDDTTLIFQWESESSAKYLKKFMSDSTIGKVRNTIPDFSYIKWFSFGNGLIRPACASYRDEVANGEFSTTGLKELDEFLAPTLGRITMQEDIMRFLVKFCGYSQAESDTVRRGIAKKKGTEQLLPEIERRFVEYVNAEFGVDKVKAQEVIKPFIQTILDASSYAFSWNHSDAYSCIGYISGYLRYYYPLEFLTASFNTFSDKLDKTQKVTDYAKKHNVKIKAPKFGYAHNEYMCDKESNTIYKGLGSIKDMQSIAADIMLDIADKNPETFVDLLFLTEECKIDNKKINKKSLDILLNIGFFDVFGTIPELKSILHWFDKYKKCKTVKRETLTDEWLIEIIRKNAGKESKKQFREIDNKRIVKDIYNILPKQAEDNTALIRNQIKHLGYADVGNDNISPLEYYVQDVNEDKWGRIWLSLYQLSSGISKRYKCDKIWFKRLPCIKDDIIKAIFKSKEKMKVVGEDEDGKKIFARTGEYENIVKGYSIVK